MIISSFIAPAPAASSAPGQRQDMPVTAQKGADSARPAAIIDISAEAVTAGKTDQLVAARLGDVTKTLFEGVSPYREDLAAMADQGINYTEDGESVGQLLAKREWAAYGHHQSWSGKFKAMIEYYDSLSPAEQNSERYRGMRANAMENYRIAVEMENGKAENLEENQNLAINLFELLDLPEPSVEKLRGVETAYERMLDRLEGFAGDGFLRERAVEAGERFDAMMRTVEAGAAGDEGALSMLTALADGAMNGAAFTEAAQTYA